MRLRLRDKLREKEAQTKSTRDLDLQKESAKAHEREPTQNLGEIFIVQADGEILRSPRETSHEELELISTAAALMALGISQKKWPAWVDLKDHGQRLLAVAFDEQIIFMKSVKGRDQDKVSRVDFIESTRRMVAGR